jgi:hypothetical protein
VSPLRRHLGLLLALALCAGAVGLRVAKYSDDWQAWDRYKMPTFDPYVYLAMIEQPSFFTIYPWGYRLAPPFLIHSLPFRDPLRAYRAVDLGALVLCGPLLYLFLRRLGHAAWAALLAVAVFALSAPVETLVQSPYLFDSLALLLEIALLLALQAEVGGAWLAVLLVWGVYTKELYVVFPAALFMIELPRYGPRRALLRAGLTGAAPLLAMRLVKWWWTPGLETPTVDVTLDLLGRAALDLFGDSWSSTWPALFLSGLTPLALLGALRRPARPFLWRFGILLPPILAVPLLAWLAVPGKTALFLFGDNTLRLMVYTLPLLLPLALVALDRVLPNVGEPAPPRPLPWPRLALALLALSLAFPLLALDRYRRIPFPYVRDGPLVLTLCRQTLRTARQVESGKTVEWDVDAMGWDPESRDTAKMQQMRWFLRRGWGGSPHYSLEPARMEAEQAELLLPVLEVTDREVVLTLSGEGTLEAGVNGVRLAATGLQAEPAELALRVPASALFRGDNLIVLTAKRPGASGPGPRLHRVRIRAAG